MHIVGKGLRSRLLSASEAAQLVEGSSQCLPRLAFRTLLLLPDPPHIKRCRPTVRGVSDRNLARSLRHFSSGVRAIVDAGGLCRGQFPAETSQIFGSEFGPRDPSRCVGLFLLCILVVCSAPELNSGPVSQPCSRPDFFGVRNPDSEAVKSPI
jgi:hypothetical protein